MGQEASGQGSIQAPLPESTGAESHPITQGPPDVKEAVRKLSDAKPDVGKEFRAMMGVNVSGAHPIHEKMNEKHIATVLELAVKHDEREYLLALGQQEYVSSNRWFMLAVFVITLLTIGFLVVFLKDKPEILIPVLSGLLGFAAGALAGFGFGKSKA